MPKSASDSIRARCRKRIAAWRATNDCPDQLETWIVGLVEGNLANGRFQRLAASRTKRHPLGLEEYIDRVISYARQEYARVHALEQAEPNEWNRLRDLLYHRAIPMVRHFRNGSEVIDEASDFAQQACAIIFDERYPCDVSFEAWAVTILKNLVLAHYARSPDVLNRPDRLRSLDQPKLADGEGDTLLSDLLADPDSPKPFDRIEDQIILLEAVERLGPTQRQVIRWSFLEELEDAQIAKRLGKSKQAVYNLRQRALVRLKILLVEPPRKKAAQKSIN